MKRSILKPGLVLIAAATILFLNSGLMSAQNISLDAARLLTRSEAYDNAAKMFEQLIAKEPGNSKYYFYYGENWMMDYFSDTLSNSIDNFTKEAKLVYNKGVTANPNDPLNYIGLAKVAFFIKDNKTADEMRAKAKSFLLPYKNIKKMVPPAKDYALTLAKLAESYITVDSKVDTSKALPLLREAIKIDSKSRDIYLIAGDIYNIKNDGSNAIKYYNLAQEYDPASPTAAMKIGSIYVRAKNLTAAIPYFEEAIRLNANYAPAYRELAALYLMARRYDDAKKNFEKYLELTQGNIPAKISYVRSLYFAGEYDEVIKNIEEIFAIDKTKTYLNRLAAYSCYEKKDADYDKALAYMETLFRDLSPDLIIKRDYLYMAKILLRKNSAYPKTVAERDRFATQLERDRARYNSAATAAEKARIKPTVDTLNARIGRLNKQIAAADKEIDRAFGEYNKALTFDPEDRALLTEMSNAYYQYRRYSMAARTWAKVIALGRDDIKDYLQLGRWYLNAEEYKSADSVFADIQKKNPQAVEAYLFQARTGARIEGDPKSGQARPKFEKVIDVIGADSLKNQEPLMEAYQYLGYHFMLNDNYSQARYYYLKMTTLDPNNKDYKTRGLSALGQLETRMAGNEKTIEGKLPYLARAQDYYRQVLAITPNNELIKTALKYVQDYEASVRKGINPNEQKGIVKNEAGQPVLNASVRIKDTAAETFTNARGEFKFEIPQASEAFVISASGYKQKEIPVTRPLKPLTIVLEK
jgi:tetratricopeptide (TPR) repeat protein